MTLAIYALTFCLAWLANLGYYRTCRSIGARPMPGGTLEAVYELAGTLSNWLLLALFVAGFFALPWWAPLLTLLCVAVVVNYLLYPRMPLGAEYAIIGFPAAVVGGVVFAIVAFL